MICEYAGDNEKNNNKNKQRNYQNVPLLDKKKKSDKNPNIIMQK